MDEASSLAAKLMREGERLETYLAALSEAEREVLVYSEESQWNARSLLLHLVSSERAFLGLFREIQRGGEGVEAGFSIDGFNAREQRRHATADWEELMTSFRDARRRMVRLVATLTPEDLDRQGRHPFLGVTSLRQMVKMIPIHAQTHLRDIRAALRAV